jgi:hypothetical protein
MALANPVLRRKTPSLLDGVQPRNTGAVAPTVTATIPPPGGVTRPPALKDPAAMPAPGFRPPPPAAPRNPGKGAGKGAGGGAVVDIYDLDLSGAGKGAGGGAGGGAVEDKGAPAPATSDSVDAMIREFIAGQIGRAGKANTAEEEALIRQQMADAAGGMSVNARARAGRSGMASSGALVGQEGDIRRAASQDALDQILGLRRTEEQRGIENAMGAIGAETGMRRAAADDELRRMALAALQAEMGLDAGEVDGGGPADGLLGVVGAETEAPALANAGGATAPSINNGMDAANAIPVASPPPGATQTATPGLWYHSDTRKYYVVN